MSKRPADLLGYFSRAKAACLDQTDEPQTTNSSPPKPVAIVISDDCINSQPADISQEKSKVLDIGEIVKMNDITDEDRVCLLKSLQRKLKEDEYPSSTHMENGVSKRRSLKPEHFQKFPWIAVSMREETKGVFCRACVLFLKNRDNVGGNKAGILVRKPLTRFGKLTGKSGYLTEHQKNAYHLDCMEDLDNFISIMQDNTQDIRNIASNRYKEETERQRKALLPIVDLSVSYTHLTLPTIYSV